MKTKFFLFVLAAVLAIPMQAQLTAPSKAIAMMGTDRSQVFDNAPIKANQWGQISKLDLRDPYVAWDFSTEPADWMALDNDGDGYGWEYDADNGHNGAGCLTSASYISGYGATEPDNWVISPVIPLNGILSFWACPYSGYFPDVFAVYVCVGEPTSINDFVKVGGDYAPTGWTKFEVDLMDYAGQLGCIAFRHYNCYDEWRLFIDDISIEVPLAPVAMPENLTADPAETTANVAWEDGENAAWNLRYRLYNEGVADNLLWEFEEDTNDNNNTELTGGWTSIDADGDGYGWYHLTGANFNNHGGVGHVTSASWLSSPLTPDNWLVSPQVKLDGTFSFWAAGQDPSYPNEVFAVYVSTGNPTVDEFVKIGGDFVSDAEMTQYVFDMSEYAGQMGYVAIRHYNVSDMFRLNIDDIAFVYAEPAEWIEVNNLNDVNYLIEGLDPETTYEVQVQAVGEDGRLSEWTESTIFTTLAGGNLDGRCLAPNSNYVISGTETATVTIINREEGATIYYEVWFNGELIESSSFTGDAYSFDVTGDGSYVIHAYAHLDGKQDSADGGVFFTIYEGEGEVGIDELASGKTVAGVRYYNALGQEMQQANGMTIVVTTYTDGTTSTAKVMK